MPSYTFEQVIFLISTVMLLPGIAALLVLALRGKLRAPADGWTPERFPERDWWSEADGS